PVLVGSRWQRLSAELWHAYDAGKRHERRRHAGKWEFPDSSLPANAARLYQWLDALDGGHFNVQCRGWSRHVRRFHHPDEFVRIDQQDHGTLGGWTQQRRP